MEPETFQTLDQSKPGRGAGAKAKQHEAQHSWPRSTHTGLHHHANPLFWLVAPTRAIRILMSFQQVSTRNKQQNINETVGRWVLHKRKCQLWVLFPPSQDYGLDS